ncbi:hypothetical protein SESBI_07113 [Sesbania bispinosa]|nr:hypothetical protein SESBI_07113 [Sesbania bispinosa]
MTWKCLGMIHKMIIQEFLVIPLPHSLPTSGIGGMTWSGRVYTPEEIRGGKPKK